MNVFQAAKQADCTDLADNLGLRGRRTSNGRGTWICPFHDDHSPSMATYPGERGNPSHYHCFTCCAHGDATALYAAVKGVSAYKAAQEICRERGFEFEDVPTNATDPIVQDEPEIVTAVLAVCREWREYKIRAAERQVDAALAELDQIADPDAWMWQMELHWATHFQEEAAKYKAMTDWEVLQNVREELESLGCTQYSKLRVAGFCT